MLLTVDADTEVNEKAWSNVHRHEYLISAIREPSAWALIVDCCQSCLATESTTYSFEVVIQINSLNHENDSF